MISIMNNPGQRGGKQLYNFSSLEGGGRGGEEGAKIIFLCTNYQIGRNKDKCSTKQKQIANLQGINVNNVALNTLFI